MCVCGREGWGVARLEIGSGELRRGADVLACAGRLPPPALALAAGRLGPSGMRAYKKEASRRLNLLWRGSCRLGATGERSEHLQPLLDDLWGRGGGEVGRVGEGGGDRPPLTTDATNAAMLP